MTKLTEAAKEGNASKVRELLPTSNINETDEVKRCILFVLLVIVLCGWLITEDTQKIYINYIIQFTTF